MKKCWSLSSAGGAVAPQQRTKSCCSSACLLACNACHTPSASSGHVRAVRQNRKMPKSSTAVGRQTVSHKIENIDISRISSFKINSNRKIKKLTPTPEKKVRKMPNEGWYESRCGAWTSLQSARYLRLLFWLLQPQRNRQKRRQQLQNQRS